MADEGRRTTLVVGAGSSGAVVAARLSEDAGEHVVLVEAGPDYSEVDQLPESLRDAENPSLHGHDWEHLCHFVEAGSGREPGRYPRGRVLGGTSAVNAAIALRGIPEDYDGWAREGNDEWDWSSVLPYFVQLENDVDFGAEPYHGTSGPITIARDDVATWPSALQAMVVGLERQGIPLTADHNAPGVAGFGPTPRNRIGTYRASSSVTYLAEARTRPNLDVVANTMVTRVHLEGTRAVGVRVSADGVESDISADRIVLAGGAINSPQLLMLSGIGPKEVLDHAGVPTVLHLPGVGRNLQDHPFIPMVFEATNPDESRFGFRAHLRLSSRHPGSPPHDMYVTPGYISTSSMNFTTRQGLTAAVMANPTIAKPESQGWLEITSTDPFQHPDVHLNFLGTDSDVRRLTDSVRLVYAVLTSDPMRQEIGEPVLAPTAEVVADDDLLHDYMMANVSTAFHAAGTCRMGSAGDDLAVVDQRLRVHGVDGLLVADASIMPSVTTGFTNLPCYMIGERAAAWLREDRA